MAEGYPGRAEGWMSEDERYLYEVQGYLIVRQMLDAATVQACNAALDAAPDLTTIRGEEARLDGRMLPGYHPSAAKAWGSTPSAALTGEHGRGDISLDVSESPFRELVALPSVVRYMLGMIGPQVCFSSAGGLSQTHGAEGLTLHNGGNPDGTEPDDAIDRRQRQFYRWENSQRVDLQIRSGEMGVSFALTPVGAGDGGFCCIAGSHKGNIPASLAMRRLESPQTADGVTQPVLEPGDAVIFNEACTHGTMPWKAKHERRALLYRYIPSYLSGPETEGTWRTEKLAATQGWEGPRGDLYRAMMERPWYSSVEPGYGEAARPDLPALLLLADADETADGIDGRLGSPPQHGSAKL